MTPLTALSWINDLSCMAFAIWTAPAVRRVVGGHGMQFSDPLKMIALLLASGRYAFVAARWLFGAHRELLMPAEMVARDIAYIWSILTLGAAVLVIRGYKAIDS